MARGHGKPVQISTVLVVDAVARGDEAGECSVAAVAGALDVTHSTASRLVARAETAGMLHRGRSTTDPRRTVLRLAPEGRRLQREAVAFRTARLDSLLSDWPAADVTSFTHLLERFARTARSSTTQEPP